MATNDEHRAANHSEFLDNLLQPKVSAKRPREAGSSAEQTPPKKVVKRVKKTLASKKPATSTPPLEKPAISTPTPEKSATPTPSSEKLQSSKPDEVISLSDDTSPVKQVRRALNQAGLNAELEETGSISLNTLIQDAYIGSHGEAAVDSADLAPWAGKKAASRLLGPTSEDKCTDDEAIFAGLLDDSVVAQEPLDVLPLQSKAPTMLALGVPEKKVKKVQVARFPSAPSASISSASSMPASSSSASTSSENALSASPEFLAQLKETEQPRPDVSTSQAKASTLPPPPPGNPPPNSRKFASSSSTIVTSSAGLASSSAPSLSSDLPRSKMSGLPPPNPQSQPPSSSNVPAPRPHEDRYRGPPSAEQSGRPGGHPGGRREENTRLPSAMHSSRPRTAGQLMMDAARYPFEDFKQATIRSFMDLEARFELLAVRDSPHRLSEVERGLARMESVASTQVQQLEHANLLKIQAARMEAMQKEIIALRAANDRQARMDEQLAKAETARVAMTTYYRRASELGWVGAIPPTEDIRRFPRM